MFVLAQLRVCFSYFYPLSGSLRAICFDLLRYCVTVKSSVPREDDTEGLPFSKGISVVKPRLKVRTLLKGAKLGMGHLKWRELGTI